MSQPPASSGNGRTFQQLLRKMVRERGQPVAFTEEDFEGNPTVSALGWIDYDAYHHVKAFGGEPGCSWVIDEDALLTEETYFMAGDTDSDGTHEAGINIRPARCACGKYQDMHLRYADSLGSILRYLLSNDGGGISI